MNPRTLSGTPRARRGPVWRQVLILGLATFASDSPALRAQAPAAPATVPEAPVRYDADLLPASFHQGRRQAVLQALPANAVAIFLSAPERTRQNDVKFLYRQDSDLLYLTGTHEPGSLLVLAPQGVAVDGRTVREILFVPPRDPGEEVWTGRRFGPDRAARELGVEAALPYSRLQDVLGPVMADASRRLHHLPIPDGVPQDGALYEQLALMSRAPSPDGQTLRRVLDQLRTLKTPEEMTLLQRAIDITAEAQREAMRSIEPGMHEYEVQALIEYVFARNGSFYPAFPSIVGSGENSVILHYESNRRRMEAGDLVLMDIGAEYHGYAADITRTVPVSGTFSAEQRAIYEIVLRAQEAGIAATVPGAGFGAPHQAAARVLAAGLAELGLIASPTDATGLGRFFMHGTSHYLGLDVHDVGLYGPLQPGTVITVEPGIYVAPAADIDPKWWNIGVRIEDDVLVSANGPVVLSGAAPRTVAEIEALMRERGLGNEPAGRVPPER